VTVSEQIDLALKSVMPCKERIRGGWLHSAWMFYDFMPVRTRATRGAQRKAAQDLAESLIEHHRQQLIDKALKHLPLGAAASECEVRTPRPVDSPGLMVVVEWRVKDSAVERTRRQARWRWRMSCSQQEARQP
jgi:hypothetical protein